MRFVRPAVVSAVGAAVLVFGAQAALAGKAGPTPPPQQLTVTRTLTSNVVGPLQFAVGPAGVYVADSFTSTLSRIGDPTPIATGPAPSENPEESGDLAGVDVLGRTIAYTTSTGDHSDTRLTILRPGRGPVVADLSGFEKDHNPDQVNHYGVANPTAEQTALLDQLGVPASYSGQVDSHPYAVAALPRGAWAVADAGGNDLLRVDRNGNISVIAVLPPQPVTITAELAAANGLPPEAVGITYSFEPVPTDVEVGPNGALYVTTLPGGLEGPGNPGSVYRIDHGRVTKIATGFAGATNLAIDPQGRIFVAELGSGTIAQVVHGAPVTVASLPGVVAVEFARGHLYASTAPAVSGGEGPGTVVVLGPATG